MSPQESAPKGNLYSLFFEHWDRIRSDDELIDEDTLDNVIEWIQIDWKRIKEVMEPMQKTSADDTETAAKEAFKRVQVNQHYEFEISELAGYIGSGILENIYKQAFFAGYNYRCSLEVMEDASNANINL